MNNAVSVAEQCSDERLRAELLIRSVPYQQERPVVGPKGDEALKRAQVAADRVMQPDLAAAIASHGLIAARQRDQWDEAFRLVDTELEGYGARHLPVRQLQAVSDRNQLRLLRSDPGDLKAIVADVRTWQPIAAQSHKPDLARPDRSRAILPGRCGGWPRGPLAAVAVAADVQSTKHPAFDRRGGRR
jgi:hypothetical protein